MARKGARSQAETGPGFPVGEMKVGIVQDHHLPGIYVPVIVVAEAVSHCILAVPRFPIVEVVPASQRRVCVQP